jgi:hypothetical protein
MDLTFKLQLQESIILFFFVIGFSTFIYFIIKVFLNLIHYIKYQTFIMDNEERHLFSLIEENKKLKEKNNKLENQIEEITKTLINNLQG